MTTRTLPFRPRLVEIDETHHWTLDDWPEIKAIKSTWLYDLNEQTYLCEMTPSRCLYPIDTYPMSHDEDALDDRRREHLMDEVRHHAYLDGWNVMYVHCHEADGLPGRELAQPDVSFDDVPYDDQLQAAIEYCQCNEML